MYRLLIIDDEPTVREGIKTLLSWEAYGFTHIYDGFDGKDGLSKVLELSPELVLVDIKMPGMSGIELIKRAKEEGYLGKFIILTGHSDFQFAKTAISLGVRGYLLKPIDEEELEEYVIDVSKELEAKRTMEEFMSSNELNGKKELLRKLLLSQQRKQEVEKSMKQYGLTFTYATYSVAMISTRRSNRLYIEQRLEEREIEKELLGDMEKVYLEDKLVVIGKGYKNQEFMNILSNWNDKREKIKNELYFITIGHSVANWWDICFSYECAKMLSNYQFIHEDRKIIDIHTIENLNMRKDIENFESKVLDYIEIGDKEELIKVLNEKKDYYQSQPLSESDVKVNITHSINFIYRQLEKKYEHKIEELKTLEKVLDLIKESETLHVMIHRIQEFCIHTSEVIRDSSTDNVVRRMLSYMEKNYEKELKLETLAKVFSYNSAYLGKLFKKQEGENFNNTLDRIRINNAKRLLIETDLKVYQVSEQVGYSSIDYFYSKFKRYVGISPKEYKGGMPRDKIFTEES